jgi:hypothetical protein
MIVRRSPAKFVNLGTPMSAIFKDLHARFPALTAEFTNV